MKNTFLIFSILFFLFINIKIIVAQPSDNISKVSKKKAKSEDLEYVVKFADNLLKYGLDNYGVRKTPMWASVIDVQDYSVPIRNVPPTKGVRPHDRAVGGSNFYHDVMTLKVFEALSEITRDDKYSQAAKDYSKSVLDFTQSPVTGLLGWGEHLYYNFYTDTVSIGENRILDPRANFIFPHEFLAWTPPWEQLWEIDNERTQKAIEGIKYHYNGPDPKVYLFNRHAIWSKANFQEELMPWIKHSALFSYSFAFLYNKTSNPVWKQWSKDAGMLYWDLRDKNTNLVFNCFFHPTETDAGKLAVVGGTAYYSYWLYKAYLLNDIPEMKEAALKIMEGYNNYGWDEEKQGYYSALNLNGSVPEKTKISTPWKIGYGTASILAYGRVAAFLYEKEKKDFLKEIAERAAGAINSVPLPDQFTAQNIGEAINLNMDLYQITGSKNYMEEAKNLAEIAKSSLWKNGFFVRQKDDIYYEAKLGTGDLLAGFLRIYIAENNLKVNADWSF